LQGDKVLYCFSSFKELDKRNFLDWENTRLEAVPVPILDVYHKIFKEDVIK
jgi:hypothetical protein